MEVDLHVTNHCNLRCKHCVYTSGEWVMPDMTLQNVERLIPSFKKLGVEEVHITGGEPLVNKEFFEIAKCLHENGFGTRVQTNGILITPEIAQRLKEVGIEYVLISIDGLEKSHNSFRNNENSFKYAVNAVKICLEAGLYTRVNTVINKSNVQDLPELITYINELEPNQHSFFYLTPVGRGKNIKNLMLSLEEWKNIQNVIEKAARECNCISKIRLQNVLKNDENEEGCREDNCLILANGDVFHCVFFMYSPYKLGNIYKDDLYDIWTKNIKGIIKETSKTNKLYKECHKEKQVCQCNCTGIAYNMTGNIMNCDPRCNPTKKIIHGCIRTYIKMR